jgi:O-antigen ligase
VASEIADMTRRRARSFRSMRDGTRYLLWAYMFSVPWDVVALPVVGTLSRAFGLAVVGAGLLTIAIEGRFRKPDAVLGFAIAFSVWGALSLLWTISYDDTVVYATTFAQLAASAWVIREFVRTREQMQPLLTALCCGLFVPLTDLLNNFRLGIRIGGTSTYDSRYTGVGINADGVGFLLVLGLPIAWQLFMHRRGIVRGVALIYLASAPVGLLLTATRGAFLAGVVALTIVPLTLPRQSVRSYALAGVLLILGALSVTLIVPRSSWERILTTSTEITQGGSMNGRREIWSAGLQAFPQHPVVGAGAGAFRAASKTKFPTAHNVVIGLLVEEGIVGLALFAGFFGACAWTIGRFPSADRALWGVLILTWLVNGMSGNPEGMKITWVLFGLVSAQSGLTRTVTDISPMEQAAA